MSVPAAAIPMPAALPLLDRNQRYSINEAIAYLRLGRRALYERINAGSLKVIRDGGRVYVPGTELIRLSTLSEAQSEQG